MNEIWCLFSVENDFDQPDNNLVTWFKNKPNYNDVEDALLSHLQYDGYSMYSNILPLFEGNEIRINNTYYRLQVVELGEVLK